MKPAEVKPAEVKPAEVKPAEPPRAPQGTIAVLPPPAETTPATAPPAPPVAPVQDIAATTRALQTELKRVGCDPGAVDGRWTPKSSQALELFNKSAGTKFDVKVASIDALDGVRGKTARVCPLSCGPGQRIEGDTCIAALPPQEKRPPAAERAA